MRKLRGLVATVLAVPLAIAVVAIAPTAAHAIDNGVGQTPALGWSSWSFIRHNPTAANIEATADAMVSSGLAGVGYQYVNVDDFYYLCPGSQGPNVDQYGRWVTDTTKFPAGPNGENGIQVVADYVHSKGLKFGIYVTPGISKQAVAQNTPIEGTPYHADDIATTANENNYNCKGMVGIDYSKPGAQAFIDSWANEFASWGVDYLKIDGVGTGDIPDIQAWSQALVQSGRPIHLELSNNLNISAAATWKQLSNGWRTGGDVECYCGPNGSSYPLTDWSHVSSRFNQVANWQPYGGPSAFNDYDSIEVGNGANDGLTLDERKTQMSLWALASSPFILGTDITNLDPTDLTLLKNTDVLSVDQDAIDASRVYNANGQQIFTKTEADGTVVVGLFNTSGQAQTISTSAASLGLAPGTDYAVDDLWSHQTTESTGVISPTVPSHGVAFYRVTPLTSPTAAPPNVSYGLAGPAALTGGQSATFTETFINHGDLPAKNVSLALSAPSGWTATATSPTSFPAVETEQTVSTTFAVSAPTPDSLFEPGTLTASAGYGWPKGTGLTASASQSVTVSPPVQDPYRTYSSATDAPALFAQSGDQFGISGAGADLFSGSDSYSAVYLPGSVATSSTIDTQVTSQQNLTGFGKSGIIVRNNMTGSGTSPEGVILFASPSGGIQLEWANDGGTHINSVKPPNGTIPSSTPIHLKLERTDADSYTGYYSYDGAGWYVVGSATVPGQADTQDAGIFVTSHSTGTPATAVFNGLTVTAGATPPPAGPTPYEAEASSNLLAGGARVSSCTGCSGGQKVGFIGSGGTLTFTNITAPSAGSYQVTIAYLDGSTTGRQAMVSANGGPAQTVSFTPTGSFNIVGTTTVTVQLNAGANTILFANPGDFAPDIDRILVASTPS
jgi:Alpha galactosidase A/NPCBM-associated, NEW3 domain of alpha-galactosidase/Alpha galactosidase C-terminal beta sandwich domain